jgi:hypothetical protein
MIRVVFRARHIGTAGGLALVLSACLACPAFASQIEFSRPVKLAGAAAGTEPRLAVGAGHQLWAITNDAQSGLPVVFGAKDGATWTRTAGEFPASGFNNSELVITPSGRLIGVAPDGTGLGLVVAYSNDRGRVWETASGVDSLDQDRPWLAVGPVDPVTHEPPVYLLFHNFVTGPAFHNMFVATSVDGGRSFGPPVAVALPGSEAYNDLQCAPGAPSGIAVDQNTGQVYVSFGTRSSALGGCGSLFSSAKVSLAGETRVWVATSPDASAGSWQTHLAADAGTRMVSASYEPIAVDPSGKIYVAYAETAGAYPDFSRASVRYVWAPAGGANWAKPVTVVPGSPVGHYDPSIVAAGQGNLGFAYYTGVARAKGDPLWFVHVAVVRNAESTHPDVRDARVVDLPAYAGTADAMAGSCGTGLVAGLESGLLCGGAASVWGLALDTRCRLVVAFPTEANDGPGADPGTFVATQQAGPSVCGDDIQPSAVHLVLGHVTGLATGRLAVRLRAVGGTVRSVSATLMLRTGRRYVRVARGTTRSVGRHGARIRMKTSTGRRLAPGSYRLKVTARDRIGRRVRASRTLTVRGSRRPGKLARQ